MRRRYTEAQRKSLLDEWRNTGESLRAVAKRRGIEPSTAYQWSRRSAEGRAKREPSSKVSFAQIVRASGAPPATASPCVLVRIGCAVIQVGEGFDGERLREVLGALARELG